MNIWKKAERILYNQGVTITALTGNAVYFDVRNKNKVYGVYYIKNKNMWFCDCMAGTFMKKCCHVIASKVYFTKKHKPEIMGKRDF